MDLIKDKLQDNAEYRFDNTYDIEIPIVDDGGIERYEQYQLDRCGTSESETTIPGNSYGIHGEVAEKNVPDDFDWYARATSSDVWIEDVYIYGYFDNQNVLIRSETSMSHRTADYYWIRSDQIKH